MRAVIAIFCVGLLLSCGSVRSRNTHRLELILTPHAKAVLYTDTDSLNSLLHPVECNRIEECYMGYSTPDTSFSIGFSLDTNTKDISAAEWLRIDVAQRQIEVGNGLNVTVVEHVPNCAECAYAYYVQDNSLGRVSYFTGVVVRNGFLAGVYSQLVQRDARLFADECAVLLKGIEVEAL